MDVAIALLEHVDGLQRYSIRVDLTGTTYGLRFLSQCLREAHCTQGFSTIF
jgi:hypothetical protein